MSDKKVQIPVITVSRGAPPAASKPSWAKPEIAAEPSKPSPSEKMAELLRKLRRGGRRMTDAKRKEIDAALSAYDSQAKKGE